MIQYLLQQLKSEKESFICYEVFLTNFKLMYWPLIKSRVHALDFNLNQNSKFLTTVESGQGWLCDVQDVW